MIGTLAALTDAEPNLGQAELIVEAEAFAKLQRATGVSGEDAFGTVRALTGSVGLSREEAIDRSAVLLNSGFTPQAVQEIARKSGEVGGEDFLSLIFAARDKVDPGRLGRDAPTLITNLTKLDAEGNLDEALTDVGITREQTLVERLNVLRQGRENDSITDAQFDLAIGGAQNRRTVEPLIASLADLPAARESLQSGSADQEIEKLLRSRAVRFAEKARQRELGQTVASEDFDEGSNAVEAFEDFKEVSQEAGEGNVFVGTLRRILDPAVGKDAADRVAQRREESGLEAADSDDNASRVDVFRRAMVNVLERQVKAETLKPNSRDTILEQFDSVTAQGIEPRQAIELVGSPNEGLLDFVFGPSQAKAGILADEVEFEARRIRRQTPELVDDDSLLDPVEGEQNLQGQSDLSRTALGNVLERQIDRGEASPDVRRGVLRDFDNFTRVGLDPKQAIDAAATQRAGLLRFSSDTVRPIGTVLVERVEEEMNRIAAVMTTEFEPGETEEPTEPIDPPEQTADAPTSFDDGESVPVRAEVPLPVRIIKDSGVLDLPSNQPGGEFIASPPTPQIEPGEFTRPTPQTSDPVPTDEPFALPSSPSPFRPAARSRPVPPRPQITQAEAFPLPGEGGGVGGVSRGGFAGDLPIETQAAAA